MVTKPDVTTEQTASQSTHIPLDTTRSTSNDNVSHFCHINIGFLLVAHNFRKLI